MIPAEKMGRARTSKLYDAVTALRVRGTPLMTNTAIRSESPSMSASIYMHSFIQMYTREDLSVWEWR